jgi:hypothetical protein
MYDALYAMHLLFSTVNEVGNPSQIRLFFAHINNFFNMSFFEELKISTKCVQSPSGSI